ncbi:L-dopachrome tautomerase-related protein [Singulisphaera sp. PoT]|uniref:L-dopachrome tautomerase-related protein n=1 Tax=Singulisphaera sp. PoT TaxID=3411797 RepID=UPI003BF5D3A9
MKMTWLRWLATSLPVVGLTSPAITLAGELAQDRPTGRLEIVATFDGPMPTGVTVSRTGRIFVNFPRWGDKVDFTVAELKHGEAVAFPGAEINLSDETHASRRLISVQSVVVDPLDRLWIVDTGSIEFGPTVPGGPKLIGVDLTTDKIFKTILFPADVALTTSYLNDVRFDLRRGEAGYAFLTDSSGNGPNGIIVVDLESGKSWRRLDDHPSTKAESGFLPLIEGLPLRETKLSGEEKPLSLGSDGIAIGHDGKRLFYCPLISRKLYSVSIDALVDGRQSDEQVAKTVIDHGEKGASDGLESDDKGRIYATNYEQNAIVRRLADGSIETIVHDPRVLWPDTLSVAADGYLYFTANQLHRQAAYNKGKDLRQKPYVLFRTPIDSEPVRLIR